MSITVLYVRLLLALFVSHRRMSSCIVWMFFRGRYRCPSLSADRPGSDICEIDVLASPSMFKQDYVSAPAGYCHSTRDISRLSRGWSPANTRLYYALCPTLNNMHSVVTGETRPIMKLPRRPRCAHKRASTHAANNSFSNPHPSVRWSCWCKLDSSLNPLFTPAVVRGRLQNLIKF